MFMLDLGKELNTSQRHTALVGTVDKVDSLGLVVCSSITEFVVFQVFYRKKILLSYHIRYIIEFLPLILATLSSDKNDKVNDYLARIH